MSRCEQQVDANGNWYYAGDCGELRDELTKLREENQRLRDHITRHLKADCDGELILARYYGQHETVAFDGLYLDSGESGGCLYLYRLKQLEGK